MFFSHYTEERLPCCSGADPEEVRWVRTNYTSSLAMLDDASSSTSLQPVSSSEEPPATTVSPLEATTVSPPVTIVHRLSLLQDVYWRLINGRGM